MYSSSDATGISHDQLFPAYTKLIDTTHSVTESQHILTTAMNISAETHKPLEAVVLALGKAYDGSTAGLSRYGIETKTASGKTMDFKQVMESANKVFGTAVCLSEALWLASDKTIAVRGTALQHDAIERLLISLRDIATQQAEKATAAGPK